MTAWRERKEFVPVNDKRMAYVETGEGDPIVFLHGNPTSSYLWRNVISHVEEQGRCITPDLIGMGDSDKLDHSGPDSYRFVEHREYLDRFLDALGVTDRVTFVVHDWGSALGFDWARRHAEAIRGIAFMEAIVRPVTWDEWPEQATEIFQALRSPAGEELALTNNAFVELILPSAILRQLTDEEMEEYRRPFGEPGEGRRPTLTWPRELPIEGEPADVVQIVRQYSDWISSADVPTLFVDAEPGAILAGPQGDFARPWPDQVVVTVPGIHYIQEDSADLIGRAISEWLPGLR